MESRLSTDRSSERGIALLLTLLVLTVLIIISVQLAYSTKVGFGIAKDRRNEMQLDYAIRGVVYKAQAILRYDAAQGEIDSKQDEWNSADFSDPEDPGPGFQEETKAAELDDTEEIRIRARIIDEDSKFNLVHLLPRRPDPEKAASDRDPNAGDARGAGRVNTNQPRADLKDKPREKPFDEQKEKERQKRAIAILASIIDEYRHGTLYDLSPAEARDLAEAVSRFVNRSESGHGGQGVDRMRTRSGMPLSLDELLLIEGMTERLLWDFRDPDDEREIVPGLCNYITIWSSGKINVNTGAEVVLRALFDDSRRDMAHDIVVARGDEEEEKENERLSRLSRRDREEELRKKKIEERRKRKRAAKGGDLFGPGGSGDDRADGAGPFQDLSELQQKNVLSNEDFQKVLPYLGVRSEVFSIHIDARKSRTRKYQHVVLRRLGEGDFATILWETRRNRRLVRDNVYEMEDEEAGSSLF